MYGISTVEEIGDNPARDVNAFLVGIFGHVCWSMEFQPVVVLCFLMLVFEYSFMEFQPVFLCVLLNISSMELQSVILYFLNVMLLNIYGISTCLLFAFWFVPLSRAAGFVV